MVNKTLKKATTVSNQLKETIDDSNTIIQNYEREHQRFDDKCTDMLEQCVRSQQAKYTKVRSVVEPNLSRRMELRRERARIKALREEMASQNCFEEIPLEIAKAQEDKLTQMYNTYHGKLEQIKEEPGRSNTNTQMTLVAEDSFDINKNSKMADGQKNQLQNV